MTETQPTYRIEITNSGTPLKGAFGWKINRNHDVLPILRSRQPFASRVAAIADAHRSRLQLVNAGNVGGSPRSA
jgi:hypothetical protein